MCVFFVKTSVSAAECPLLKGNVWFENLHFPS